MSRYKKLEDVPVKDLKISINETIGGRFRLYIRHGHNLKLYIGTFDNDDECYKAFDECKHDFSKREKYRVKRSFIERLPKKKEEKIIDYFWNNIENSDPTIAKLFNVDEWLVRLITDRVTIEHFERVNKRVNAE